MTCARMLCFALTATSPLSAQLVLAQHQVPPGTEFGARVASVGDLDADGYDDFAVTDPTNVDSVVRAFSGQDATPLYDIPFTQNSNRLEVVGIDDTDDDAVGDLVVLGTEELHCISGVDGTFRWLRRSTDPFEVAANLGDYDGDGHGDIAVIDDNGTVRLLSGVDGTELAPQFSVPGTTSNGFKHMTPLGDLTGDGKTELAVGAGRGFAWVMRINLGVVWRTIALPQNDLVTNAFVGSDIDGDGVSEIVMANQDRRVRIYDAVLGALRTEFSYEDFLSGDPAEGLAAVGDLNEDGTVDIALGGEQSGDYGAVAAFCGASGRTLWTFEGYPPFTKLGAGVAGIGDQDDDGFVDVAISSHRLEGHGVITLSGRILASVADGGGACGGGPFLPELGTTRWRIGESSTIVCRDGPPGAQNTLCFSLRPEAPTYLGASTCFAGIDLDGWVGLFNTPQSDWELTLGVPDVPQLAGIEVALQTVHWPTVSPLGIDLSNALWLRVGY